MTLLIGFTTADLAVALLVSSIAYVAWVVVYRLWFSPVAGFPGSFWPKITFWYEFYYEWIKPGQYHRRIHEMHQQYGKRIYIEGLKGQRQLNSQIGPIIRVSPEEIHISDAPFYHELFVPANVRRTNAYGRYAQGTGFEGEHYSIHMSAWIWMD